MEQDGKEAVAWRVAFVELPDEALDLMSYFTQRADARVVLVVSQDPESYAVRMAEILHVPVLDTPNRLSLLTCTHVLVGPQPDTILPRLRDLLDGTGSQVIPVDDAMQQFLGRESRELEFELPSTELTEPVEEHADSIPAAAPETPKPPTAEAALGEADLDALLFEKAPLENPESDLPRAELAAEDLPGPEAEPDHLPRTDIGASHQAAEAHLAGAPARKPLSSGQFEVVLERAEDPGAPVEPRVVGTARGLAKPAQNEPAEESPNRIRILHSSGERKRRPGDSMIILQPGESFPPRSSKAPETPEDKPAEPQPGQPAPQSPSRERGGSRYRLDSLFGEGLAEDLGALSLDDSGGDLLQRILEIAIRAVHAESGSIMLPDLDGKHLQIAAAKGLADAISLETRERIGTGMAGEVFANREPVLIRGRLHPEDQEHEFRAGSFDSAVVPILSGDRSVGVLCVNSAAGSQLFSEDTVVLLTRFAREASAVILKAVDLGSLSDERRHAALYRQMQRLMSLDDSLVNRLRAVVEAARKAFRAEYSHLFLVDPVGSRLELVTQARGLGQTQARFCSMDSGMYSWALRKGEPAAFPLWNARTGKGYSLLLLPIVAEEPLGLLVLEQVPMSHPEESESLLEQAGFLVRQIADLYSLERSIGSEELFNELRMRVVDQSARLEALLPHERAKAALGFAVELLAAETAVWCSEAEARPVWLRPTGRAAVSLQAALRPGLPAIADAVRATGRLAHHPSRPNAEFHTGIDAPAPFLGVRVGDGEGVLLVIFHPEEEGGALSQIPVPTLLDTLSGIAELLPSTLQRNAGDRERAA